jgi:hypothetical protein
VKVSEVGTVNLLSRSSGEYKISELGFHKRKAGRDKARCSEKAYRCSSREMHIFGSVASGSSSVVHRAIFMPVHRIMALKKINVFEKVRFFMLFQFLDKTLTAFFTPSSYALLLQLC